MQWKYILVWRQLWRGALEGVRAPFTVLQSRRTGPIMTDCSASHRPILAFGVAVNLEEPPLGSRFP